MSRYKLPYTLFKRGKYWYYRTYTLDGVRTVPKSTGCKTKGEAARYCENLYLKGTLNESDISFYKFAHNFYDDDSLFVKDRTKPIAENTLLNLRSVYTHTIEPRFKNYKLKDINYIELKKFRRELIDKGYKIGTVKQYFVTLQNIINAAYRQDLINKNPFDKLDYLESEESSKEAFSLDQIKLLYNNIAPHYKNIILLLALTGMRVNEGLGVTSDDIFYTGKTYYIKLNKQKLNSGKYAPVKTKDVRDIPIIEEVKDLVNNNVKYPSLSVAVKVLNPKLFNNNNLTIHSLRHFFITNTKAKNINPVKIKKISGHRLENKVEDTYTNFTPDDLIDILPWQKEIYKYITE